MTNQDSPPSPLERHVQAGVLKHSGLGITSFIVGIVAGVALFVSFGVAGFIHLQNPEGMDENSPVAMVIGMLIIGLCLIHLLGVGLAIGGLVQTDRRKVFPVMGLIVNALAILLTVGLIVLGNVSG
ncbi:MAG: hypothetical protein JNG83_08600 [Opitutaceae bacterium]|nr:hypothetical protein [Opitutaceae bacterium]